MNTWTPAPRAGLASKALGLVNAVAFAWDPIRYFERLRDEQGDFARTRIGWQDLVLLGHPELVHELFVVRQAQFHKGYTLSRMKVLVGQGLLTSEGELHRRQRRRIQPAFHAREVATHGAVMARFAEEAGSHWHDGQQVDVADEMLRLGQRIVAKALFDTDIEAADARQAAEALNEVVRGFHLLLMPLADHLLALPLPGPARIRRARRVLDRIIGNMIAERRASGDRGDLLSRLLFPDDGAGEGAVDERQVRDEAMTIFLAGHDTTGNALAWTWHLLGLNPAAERT